MILGPKILLELVKKIPVTLPAGRERLQVFSEDVKLRMEVFIK